MDTYGHTDHLSSVRDHFISCRRLLLSLLYTKEHHFLIMSPVAYFYQQDYREEKVTQSRRLRRRFQIDDAV